MKAQKIFLQYTHKHDDDVHPSSTFQKQNIYSFCIAGITYPTTINIHSELRQTHYVSYRLLLLSTRAHPRKIDDHKTMKYGFNGFGY